MIEPRCFDLPIVNAAPARSPSLAASFTSLAVLLAAATLDAAIPKPAPQVRLVRCWDGHPMRSDYSCCPQCGGLRA